MNLAKMSGLVILVFCVLAPRTGHAVVVVGNFYVWGLGELVEAKTRITSPANETFLYQRLRAYAEVRHETAVIDTDTKHEWRIPGFSLTVRAHAKDEDPVPFCDYCGEGWGKGLNATGVPFYNKSWGPVCDEYQPGIKW